MAESKAKGVRVDATVASRGFESAVQLPAGQVTAVVGPNGSGKSTLVSLISGLLTPSSGSVEIDGVAVASGGQVIPPHRRPVALLDQRPLLFPHLSVLDNVAFGVRSRGASKAEARTRALAELDAVGALTFAGRRPRALSGGEAQRVALARALATDPTVVLLDEPFASLDVSTAASLRQLLAERLKGASAQNGDPVAPKRPDWGTSGQLVPTFAQPAAPTVVLVTHDPLDVWALADHVVALDAGRAAAQGSVEELLGRPPTRFLAELSGMNLIAGTASPSGSEPDPLGLVVRTPDVTVAGLWDATRHATPGQHALATFTPSAVGLFADSPHGSPRNTWEVTVTGLDPRGATVRVLLALPDGQALSADLTAQGVAALGVRPGQQLLAQVKATQVALYARG